MKKGRKCMGTSRGACPTEARLSHANSLRCMACGQAQNRLATLARITARRRAGLKPESRREPYHQPAKHSKAADKDGAKQVAPEPRGPKYFERLVNAAINQA